MRNTEVLWYTCANLYGSLITDSRAALLTQALQFGITLRPSQHRSSGSTESTSAKGQQREDLWLSLLLVYVLVRGLLQVAVVPPWQHYDEPTHFEYAWLIANRQSLPQSGDYDQVMRREVVASMLEHDFFRNLNLRPNLLPRDKPYWIGISELRHPPLYYVLAAVTQWPVMHASVEMQLYAGRLVGLLSLTATILIAYRLAKALFPERRLLYLGVPVCLAFLLPYVDQMTSVNNDVLTTPLFFLFILMLVLLIRDGLSWWRLVLAIGSLALAMMTKATAVMGIPALFVALPMIIFRQAWGKRIWVVIGAGILAAGFAFLQWGDAAGWYKFGRSEFQSSKSHARLQTPVGQDALYVEDRSEEENHYLYQELARDQGNALAGKTATLAGWVRSAKPSEEIAQIGCFSLYDGQVRHEWPIEASSNWEFHAFTVTIKADAKGIAVGLHPYVKGGSKTGAFYATGLVLVEGEDWPRDLPPAWDDAQAEQGIWGGRPIVNLLHNGTGHRKMIGLSPTRGGSQLKLGWWDLATVLQSALEWRRTGWFSRLIVTNLYQSFWGRFSWNQVTLSKGWFRLLLIPTIAGGLGMLRLFLREFRSQDASLERWQQRALVLLATTLALAWINAWLRGHPLFLTLHKFIPSARYAHPVAVVSATFLLTGVLEWWRERWRPLVLYLCMAGMFLLDTVAWLGVLVPYYYGAL